MSNLRTKMTQDMIVRGLATSTQKAYLHAVTELSDYYDQCNPASLSKQELLDYLVHLSQERGLAWGTCNGRVHALRFFYQVTLGRTDVALVLPRAKEPSKLPVIWSQQDIRNLLTAAPTQTSTRLSQDRLRHGLARQRSHSTQNHGYRQPTHDRAGRARQAQKRPLHLAVQGTFAGVARLLGDSPL